MNIEEIEPDHPLYNFIKLIRDKIKPRRKNLMAMDDDDVKAYNEIEALRKRASALMEEFNVRSKKFMLDLKVKYKVFDKDIYINVDTQHLEVDDEAD